MASEAVLHNMPPPRVRYVPWIRNLTVRAALGLVLLLSCTWVASSLLSAAPTGALVVLTAASWSIAAFLTDKYRHKYPQRYLPYLLASHLKAAIIMAILLWLASGIAGPSVFPRNVLWTSLGLFVVADAVLSLPRRREDLEPLPVDAGAPTAQVQDARGKGPEGPVFSIDSHALVGKLPPDLDATLADFVRQHLPPSQGANDTLLIIEDKPSARAPVEQPRAGLLVGRLRINDVRRLNQYLQYCAESIAMGGYLVIRYLPLENLASDLRRRHPGWTYRPVSLLHFIWYRALPKIPYLDRLYFWSVFSWVDHLYYSVAKKRNRALSKAEVWGRLSFCGMQVIAESRGEGDLILIAQKQGAPIQHRMPSYYLIASLEKIGLDGRPIRTHKIRSMYPFSEFLQKRIFEEHGLAETGKFQNDFRLTEYGKFVRKYWLDELPQIYDWLRGDIKLVGMRATSRQYLSLYPKELYDLYVQVKPGLVPPIFNETTGGFDQIVDVEMTYLRRYWARPMLTDLQYLWQTFSDIVFRGIRSK
jgi:lipopolysaccharide/colanic/teichoic acid biosynthesis glycosyltransferase